MGYRFPSLNAMQYSFFRSVFFHAALPVALASLVWPTQQSPAQGNVLPVPQPTVTQPQLSQANGWNSVLHVARFVESRQRSTNLVLQLEVLSKPQTTYANAVYQVFARTRGDSEWQEIHTNRGARLMPGNSGQFILESEVISIADLEAEIRDELGEDLRIEDVELDCVVSIRYDLVGGGRDLREKITYQESYSQISTTSTTEVVRTSTSSTVTAHRTSSTDTVVTGQHSRRQTVDGRGRHDDDWDDHDDDDDDRDDDDHRRGRRRRNGSHSRTEEVSHRSSGSRSQRQSQTSQTNIWESVLHVARQTSSSQQRRNLVLQLEILNKPQTTYANVVYQVFARTRGGRWQEIHTNRGARLIEASRGRYVLTSEVISIAQLEEELRAELGDDLRLEDVEINCVASVRYDLAGGSRDIRESFSYRQSYTSVVTTTTTEITQIVGSSITVVDDHWDDDYDDGGRHRRRGRRRRNCNQGIGNGPEGCDPGNSRPHGGSNDEGGRRSRRGGRR